MLKPIQLTKSAQLDVSKQQLISTISSSPFPPVKLQYLEVQVLIFLYNNANKISTKDSLAHLWDSGAPSDNAIAQTISKIRNKLKQIDPNQSCIQTVPKKGYIFSDENAELEQNIDFNTSKCAGAETQARGTNIHTRFLLGLTLLFLVIGVYIFLTNQNNTQSPIFSTELTDAETMKLELFANRDGSKILYSAQRRGHDEWGVGYQDLINEKNSFITFEGADIFSPTWLNETDLVYRLHVDGGCIIELNSVDSFLLGHRGQRLFSCSPLTAGFSIAKLDSEHILFTDAPRGSMPSALYKGNVKTGLIRTIAINDTDDVGPYRVFVSPNQRYVTTLSSVRRPSTTIKIFDQSDLFTPIWTKVIGIPLISIGLSDSHIIFKNSMGGISSYSFEDTKLQELRSFVLTSPINAISSDGMNNVFLLSGDRYSDNLSFESISSKVKQSITNDDGVRNMRPKLLDNDHVMYISNRTGKYQIWIFNTSTKLNKQISHFKSSYLIRDYDYDVSSQLVAIETEANIHIYQLGGKVNEKPKLIIEGTKPRFDSGKLYYSKRVGGQYNLFELDLSTKKQTQLTQYGGYDSVIFGGNVYFTKYDLIGLWVIDGNVDKLISSSILPSKMYSYNDIFFYHDRSGVNELNIHTGDFTLITGVECELITYDKDQMCVSVNRVKNANKIIKLQNLIY